MNPSPSLIARLLLHWKDKIALESGRDLELSEFLTPEEIQEIRNYLLENAESNRSVYHIEILPPSDIRRNSHGNKDGQFHILWNARDWETDIRKRKEDSAKMEARVKEYNNKSEAIEILAKKMSERMMLPYEMTKPLALDMVMRKDVFAAKEIYGVDISELI